MFDAFLVRGTRTDSSRSGRLTCFPQHLLRCCGRLLLLPVLVLHLLGPQLPMALPLAEHWLTATGRTVTLVPPCIQSTVPLWATRL
jgi:hypothetical protein